MNWGQLFADFYSGKPDAIQAIFSILGFVITLLGTLYVAITFHQQKKINTTQERLNILALEKDRRDLLPYFIGNESYAWVTAEDDEMNYELILKDNKALNVEVFPVDSQGKFSTPIYFPCQVVVPGEEKPFDTIQIKRTNSYNKNDFSMQYLIYFTDEVGRPYTQDVGHNGYKCVLLYPQSVDQEFRKALPYKNQL